MSPTPQTPPTDRPLTAGDARMMEQIAHNLCSLHDFDVALVAGLERFAKAVITEYERARPATSAASEGSVLATMRDHYQFALKGPWQGVQTPHYALAGLFKVAGDEIERLAALASPPVSERERELEGALRRISAMTPSAANAGSARDLHLTVKAIADEALTAQPAGEGK